jgi:hypothetical protein
VSFSPRKSRTVVYDTPPSPTHANSIITANQICTPTPLSPLAVTQIDSAGEVAYIPSHRRNVSSGLTNYSVSLETRATFPPKYPHRETGKKGWYVVGRGYDIGVFYDEWYFLLIFILPGFSASFSKAMGGTTDWGS